MGYTLKNLKLIASALRKNFYGRRSFYRARDYERFVISRRARDTHAKNETRNNLSTRMYKTLQLSL